MYQILVVLTAMTHIAFICYVALGGFLALRWRRSLWLHLAAVVWGILIIIAHLDCPLTWLENRARAKAGMAPLPPEGFVDHYLTGVVYPADRVAAAELTVAIMVALSWVLYASRAHRSARAR